MTLRSQILQTETGFDLLALDTEYTGSCPCATVAGEGIHVEMNCWRTGQWYSATEQQCDHNEPCAHLWGTDDEVVAHVRSVLDAMDWYGEWTVVAEQGVVTP